METNILLESGTNELEILEFIVGQNHYGINVAKIREILPYQVPTEIPNSHECIEGIFMPREDIITVINLYRVLGIKPFDTTGSDMYIVTNFNQLNIAFHVSSVIGITRISWTEITKPDASISNSRTGIATGIFKKDGKLIVILDFERIVSDISPETGLKMSEIDSLGVRERNDTPIIIAEDSPLLSKLMHDALTKAGYTTVTMTNNGKECYDQLCLYKQEGILSQRAKLVITDIEMPQMDGHHLCKLIKDDPELKVLPVVIFSSLVNDQMRRKGESVGADFQLSKPEIGQLVQTVDKLIIKYADENKDK